MRRIRSGCGRVLNCAAQVLAVVQLHSVAQLSVD